MTKFTKDKNQQFKDMVEQKREQRDTKLAQVAEVKKFTTDELEEKIESKQENATRNLNNYKDQ